MKSAYQITHDLWQGALQPVAEEWATLADNIDVVLQMASDVEIIPIEATDPQLIIKIPIDDNPGGLDESVFLNIYKLCRALSSNRVLTVCHMGENRSGLASAMVLHARGYKISEAIDLIRSKVPPRTANPHVLWNPGFERQLLEDLKPQIKKGDTPPSDHLDSSGN